VNGRKDFSEREIETSSAEEGGSGFPEGKSANLLPDREGRLGLPEGESANVSPARETNIDPAKTVGGQAVLEGVMMRAPAAWSVAVRGPDGKIIARRENLTRLSERKRGARVPFVRGIFVLGESLTLGFKALSWSAQKATDEEEEPLTGAQIGWTMALDLLRWCVHPATRVCRRFRRRRIGHLVQCFRGLYQTRAFCRIHLGHRQIEGNRPRIRIPRRRAHVDPCL